jgi:hypothetical protein
MHIITIISHGQQHAAAGSILSSFNDTNPTPNPHNLLKDSSIKTAKAKNTNIFHILYTDIIHEIDTFTPIII